MGTVHMGRFSDTRRSTDSDDQEIDQLFAPEPVSDADHHPRLLFTEPDDGSADQFLDEATAFVEQAAPVPVRPAVPLVPAGAPRTPKAAGKPDRRLFYAVGALGVMLGLLGALLMPERLRPEAAEAAPPARAVAEPQPDSRIALAQPAPAPPASPPASVEPEPSVSAGSEPSPPPLPAKRAEQPAAAMTRRSPPSNREPQVKALPPVRPAAPLPAPRLAASAPAPSRLPADLDLPRLEADTTGVLGEPVAVPPAEPPPVVVATDRGGPVRRDPSPPGAPLGATGSSGADAPGLEREKVRGLLSQYQRAYSDLDAAAAARVYPRVDRRALSRAFSTLSAQQISLDDCRIDLLQSAARATCAGTASWTPKVGGGSQDQARRWQFDLKQIAGNWQIDAVKVQ